MTTQMPYRQPADPVVVIGGGIGGLSAAIRLATAGLPVVLLEKNPGIGGKMGELRSGGYRWDTGPSVLTMRPVIEDLFTAAGRRLDDYVTLLPIDPLTRYFYPDGTVLDACRDWPRLAAQIAALEPRDVEGFLRFLAYAARLHRITGPVFIYDHPPTWRSFTRVPLADMPAVEPWLNMDRAIRRYVRLPHLRQLLGRFATYVGASPFLAPATLNVIAHVELTGGIWYPQGGLYSLARALHKLALDSGVDIRTYAEVTAINLRDGAACGVTLATGESIAASAVIANVDVATVYSRLLPQSGPKLAATRHSVLNRKTSGSGFALLLGVTKTFPDLIHHNIFFSADYRREFADIFTRGRPPADPTIYVAITSKTDPEHAPPGHENWFVLVNAPPVGDQFDWNEEAPAYRTHILERLAAFGYDIRQSIVEEHVLTPLDIARNTAAYRGALYGISSNQALNAFRRPRNRAEGVARLYFAGGTTHPGGGVPMVILSGKVAAELALADR